MRANRFAMKAAGSGSRGGASRVCDRFALRFDRSPRGVPGGARGVRERERGPASDATHSRVAVAAQPEGAAVVQSSAGRPAVRIRLGVTRPV